MNHRPHPAAAAVAAAIAAAVALAGCGAPPGTSPSSEAAPPSESAPPSGTTTSAVAPVDLAAHPSFCADIQSLIAVGDEFGGILTQFYEPRDLDLIHQWGSDLAGLYATATSLYTSLASAPDPRI